MIDFIFGVLYVVWCVVVLAVAGAVVGLVAMVIDTFFGMVKRFCKGGGR